MDILLTGGNGFLGSALAHHWCNLGYRLTLLLRPTANTERIDHLLHKVTVLDYQLPLSAYDVVVHTACSYGRQGETLSKLLDANLNFGLGVLEQVSVNAITTARPVCFINTNTALDKTVSDYAWLKHIFSQLGQKAVKRYAEQLQFIDIRLHTLFGMGDSTDRLSGMVMQACLQHQPELLLSEGKQCRDFIYVKDAVQAYTSVIQNKHHFGACDTIEVGSGKASSVRDFVENIHKLTQTRTRLCFGALPTRPNEAAYCVANIERLQHLGWQPQYTLLDGIQDMIRLEREKL